MPPIFVSVKEQSCFDYNSVELKPRSQIRLVQILPGTDFPVRCVLSVHDRRKTNDPEKTTRIYPRVHTSPVTWTELQRYENPLTIHDVSLGHDLDYNPRSDWVLNLDAPERYICLSYQRHRKTDSNDLHTIQVNGRAFAVQTNLLNFLVKARERLHSTLIWIDAICIDQSNTPERNDQVEEMGTIFEKASCVIIWLGSFEISSSDISWIRIYQNRGWGTNEELVTVLKAHNHEYWKRAWITQEVVVASACLIWLDITPVETLSVAKPMTLQRFEILYKKFTESMHLSTTDVLKMLAMRLSFILQDGHTRSLKPLRDVIEQHKMANCTEVVDRVYALRSLCREGDDIEVNYSTTRLDLLCRVMWACRGAFCLCLVLNLLDTLQLREELEINCSSAGTLNLAGLSGRSRTRQLDRPFISIATARPITSIHGPGFPLTKSTFDDLDKVFQRYPKSRALKTCECFRAIARVWSSKQGVSLCAKILCQGYAFGDVHIFFENRQGLLRATGIRTNCEDYYVQGGFPGIFLGPNISRGHRLTVTSTIRGLLNLMSLLPKHTRAEHSKKGQRPARYDVLYEHLWDRSSKSADERRTPSDEISRRPASVDWLLKQLGIKEDPRPDFRLLMSVLARSGPETLYGRKLQGSLAGDIKRDRRLHRIHQPHSRVQRKELVANCRSGSKSYKAV